MATLRVPDNLPSPTQDAEKIRNAVQGWGTDEKAVISILGRRNAAQRSRIRQTYQELYDESLIDRLYSELSGDFRRAVILWTYDPPERDARLINEALKAKKKGDKELQVIVEVACATSPHHLIAVRKAYCSLFDCSIEEDIASAVPLPIGKLLLGLVMSYRYDKELVDMDLAKTDAVRLYEAIETKKVDQDDIVDILSLRNVHQLRATFDCYQENSGCPILEDIKNCGKGDLESLLRVTILCLASPETHFAEVIGTAIIGLGTDEESLTRAIVTRAEIDTMKIRGEYFNIFKHNLDGAVTGDTSGDYRDFLMTLLGAKTRSSIISSII